jgi:hypothetical protein
MRQRLVVLVVASALGLAACAASPPETLPAEILTVWRTAAPGYADRFFELRDGWVVFGTGQSTNTAYPIEGIRSNTQFDGTRYTIEYRAEDGALVPLEIFYIPGRPATIRVGRQLNVWVPEANAGWVRKRRSA